jgi:hypothetical protein
MAASLPAQRTAIEAAADALGADAIRTLEFTASGATFTVGQNFTPDDPWPRVTLDRYTVLLDYEHARMRQELVREMGTRMPRGGGVPFTGEVRQVQLSDARSARDIPVSADPSASSLPVAPCTPPEAGGTAPKPAPAPDSQVPCALMLWATPHGFVKAARAHHATMTPAGEGTAVSFAIDDTRKMTGIIDAQHHVTRVQAWTTQSILGDMLVDDRLRSHERHADGVPAQGEGPGGSRCVHATGHTANRAEGSVCRGAVRQYPPPQARRADHRAVSRNADGRCRGSHATGRKAC